MAEFCKECFVSQLMTSKEQKLVESGNIIFKLSEGNDLCEGCGRMIPVVIQVIEEVQ